jgi:hypothetical protein
MSTRRITHKKRSYKQLKTLKSKAENVLHGTMTSHELGWPRYFSMDDKIISAIIIVIMPLSSYYKQFSIAKDKLPVLKLLYHCNYK